MKRPRASILVVEDDVSILQGLLDVLLFNGYEATGVEDGSEGLQEALGGRYDLVILDVMLPTTDNFVICREIRKKKPGQAAEKPPASPDPGEIHRTQTPKPEEWSGRRKGL
jgi:two-component system response regulator RegX3